ncbi:MAG: dicarboxylate/amino acid:cation symporter [Saprospirales bacterium]|nr:dicarboxylate/amino acid:cation symporter [Saprospirales bacterium]MBK8920845.1 dicarboxylate/amino acid:cation symporter [Saprospirales bacterium]
MGWATLPAAVPAAFRWAAILVLSYGCWRRNHLTTWILFSMVIGAEFGYDFPAIAQELKIVSQVFLKLIKTIIAPLIFGTLVVGIAGHADLKQVGRMGWKSILYFEAVTTIALFIGLFAINISKAGVGINLPPATQTEKLEVPPPMGWQETILHIFPENIAKAVAEGQVLQLVVFSILFAIGLAMIHEPHKGTMLRFAESLTEVMFKFTGIVMYFAPFAVGAAIAYTVGHMGFDILLNLLKLLGTLYAALFIFILGVLLPIALWIKLPLKKFLNAILEPATIAFSTTSSEAALPKALQAMEKFGVPRKIAAFVLPAGYSFNLDGSTLYLSLATVFVAQAAGIDLSIDQQILILLTLMLTTKGIAGVPRASLVILMATATSFGLPVEPIFIILGIDELMDMARTTVNLIGNCLASCVIAKWEGEADFDQS